MTWTAHENSIYVDVSPATGALDPNAQVSLSVVGMGTPFPDMPYTYQLPDVTITTDVPGDVVHSLAVTNTTDGYFVTPPATVAFGPVPVGMSVSKTVIRTWAPSYLTCNAYDFELNDIFGYPDPGWTLTFTPTSPGEKSSTLTISDFGTCVFPPNTFLATGTGT